MFDAPPYTGEWSLMLLDLSRRPKKGSLPKWCRWEPVYGKSHPTPRRLQLQTRCFADLKSLWFESFSFLVAWELGVNLIIIIPIPESTYKYQHSRSIAGVPFDSVRRFWASLLLHTTCNRSWCTGSAICVAAYHQKKKTRLAHRVFPGGGVPLVGPQEKLCSPIEYTPRGFSSPGREAK